MKLIQLAILTSLSFLVLRGGLVQGEDGVTSTVKVESFSPQGEVKDIRQVVARFSEPMVAFGDPRLESPFDVQCDAKGQGRWADARNWIYDFESDLPAGQKCSFTPKAGLKSLANGSVNKTSFSFTTGGPAIRVSQPAEGIEYIDEEQVFLLGLDAPANLASVRAHAACSIEGVGELIPLNIIEGSQREKILAEQSGQARNFFDVLTKRGQRGILAVKDKRLQNAAVVVARCERKFPAGSNVSLIWGKGILTTNGIPTSQDQTLGFRAREAFSVRSSCERINPNAGCVPVLPISLNFTAPIAPDLAKKIILRTKDGKEFHPVGSKEKNPQAVESISFAAPFPPASEVTITLPNNFMDDAGRSLVNEATFPLKVRIDNDPPLIKFPSRFGILELNAQPMLPVSVRNVEATLKGMQAQFGLDLQQAAINASGKGVLARLDTSDDAELAQWIDRVTKHPYDDRGKLQDFERQKNRYPREGEIPLLMGDANNDALFQTSPLSLPRAQGDKPFELIGIPLKKPGFYVVEFASNRLGAALHGEEKPYYVSSSALVTNMAVHLKKGRESSLIWVTQLDSAKPVGGAAIRVSTCDGRMLWEGKTDSKGMAHVAEELADGYFDHCSGLLVTARKDSDLSFVLSTWNDGISPWQFNLGGGSSAGPVIAHTVFDRPLFRAGETVSMKHFLRVRSGKGFNLSTDLPLTAKITHEGSGQSFDIDIQWSAGAGVSTWAIPKEAKLGSYSVAFMTERGAITSGAFRVEQYRVPLMKATLKPPLQPLVNGNKLAIDAQLNLLAGGTAAGAPVKFRSRLVRYPLQFPTYDDFSFGGVVPKEGIAAVEPYSYDPEEGSDENASTGNVDQVAGYPARTISMSLDANGGARVSFDGLPKAQESRALEIEMEYSDPNGQILTAATRALVLPSSLVLGMKIEGFYATKERMAFKVLALDTLGKPLADRKIEVDAYSRKTYAYRKRLLGGFYAYEQTAEVSRAGSVCSGKTDARGILICDGTAPDAGELILVAKSRDDQGNSAVASHELYVADENGWFTASQSDRIDVMADKRGYEPGDKARFEVRMPFREATALVTVEREGILDSFVVPLTAKSPFIDVPIAENYGPNAYVSVMVVRGRINPEVPGPFAWLKRMIYRVGMFFGIVREMPHETDTRPTALVDLTKPAFKLGMTQIRVGWKGYELKVKVEPEREAYKVRDKAMVKITVTDPSGKPASNAEIALAAVDEGLLQLASPTSWNLLEAMMERRPIEVSTSTAQSQVIGKRHFGKKAAAPGGGGGQGANARELFDTLLLWKPSIRLDKHGQARLQIPLNDSLTSFRIAAIAHSGAMRFGSATALIRSSQEVMLFSGLPPFVREGDQFSAMATVRNGGDRLLKLDVTASANTGSGVKPVGTQRVSIKPGDGVTVSFPTTVPFDAKMIDWLISAQEVGQPPQAKPAHDALKFSQKVGAAYPVRVYQQTMEQLEQGKPWNFPVQKPAGSIPGRGGVDIRLASTLGGNLEAVREWMTRYPFMCMEQRASVAIALEDEQRWNQVMNSLPLHLDRDGLVKYFPIDWLQGDDSLTAYLLAIADESHYEIPQASRESMLKGLEDFVAGRIHRYGAIQTADVVMRKLAAIDALSRYERATPQMIESLEISPNLWPSSGVIDWASLLTRMSDIPDRDEKLKDALQILRSRLFFSGTMMSFSTEKQDYLWWLMVSPDLNSVRALRLLADDPAFPAADAGRLARGALARQAGGHWTTTLANAWGVVALRHFQQRYERDPVNGTTAVKLGQKERLLSWANARSHDNGDPTSGTPIGPGLDTEFAWPSASVPLSLQHQGGGKPWAFVTSKAALPLDKPLFAGYSIKRTVSAVEQKKSGIWQRGDTYRVKLEIDAQADMTWVVVNDPIPAGASVLGSGLGGDSAQLASGEKKLGWQRPAFEERAFDGFRAYYSYVPKGKFSIEYTVRLNNPGRFEMPATRVEAMYAPEIFGELPVAKMEVQSQ